MKFFFCLLLVPAMCFALEITPPKNWTLSQTPPAGVSQQFLDSKKTGGFVSNLVVVRRKLGNSAPGFESPEKVAETIVADQSRSFPLYKVIDKKTKTINKVAGAFVVASYAYGKLDLSVLQFAYYSKGVFTTMVFTTLSRDLSQHLPEFEQSLATSKFD